MNSQSIILNLNKDFAKSEAHDYLQPVSQAFDIGANAEVCLYGANIQRKPIFIKDNSKSDNRVNIDAVFNSLPDVRQQNAYASGTLIDSNRVLKPPNVEIKGDIEDGGYTVDQFGERLTIEHNAYITQVWNDDQILDPTGTAIAIDSLPVKRQLPYAMTYDRDNFYLGYQSVPLSFMDKATAGSYPTLTTGHTVLSQVFQMDNTEGFIHTDLRYNRTQNNDLDSILDIRANSAVSVSDWSRYAQISSSPLFPLSKQHDPKELDNGFQKNQSYFEFEVNYNNQDNNYEFDACVGFTNTYLQSTWTTKDVPEREIIEPEPVLGTVVQYPQCYLGVRLHENHQGGLDWSYIELFCASKLSQEILYLQDGEDLNDALFDDSLVSLGKFDMTNTTLQGLLIGFRFNAHPNKVAVSDQIDQSSAGGVAALQTVYQNAYSFQLYINDVEGEHILYDSSTRDIYFPAQVLEDGCFVNSAVSDRVAAQRCNLGLQPYLWINKCSADDNIAALRGNYLLAKDTRTNEFIYRLPCTDYQFESASESALETLGLADDNQTTYTILKGNTHEQRLSQELTRVLNPNAFPRFPKEAGLTKLFTDSTQYNIEVNLPVKAFTTTKSTSNNLGQKRTILYKTEPVVDGESQGITQVYVNKEIVPNNLKFLTLNNKERLNLNNMNVQIRRSDTNELATELSDASVELLVKSN